MTQIIIDNDTMIVVASKSEDRKRLDRIVAQIEAEVSVINNAFARLKKIGLLHTDKIKVSTTGELDELLKANNAKLVFKHIKQII